MMLPAKFSVLLFPLFLLTGCFHFHKNAPVLTLAPPIIEAPPPKPEPSLIILPASVMTIPEEAITTTATASPVLEPKPPIKHRKKKPVPPPAETTQQASIPPPPPGVSAIGQLSSGDSTDMHGQTANSIATTERELNGITRKLSGQEDHTAVQIREFLKQARAALAAGDVDGANTLAAKAKVLLGELSR